MPRQPQLHGAIQVVGHAAQQGLLHLLPIAACRNGPPKPALDDGHERFDFPPLALGLPGTGQLPLAAIGASGHALRWASGDRWHEALEAEFFAPPAVVRLAIITAIGQQAWAGPSNQRWCHHGAKCPMIPPRSPVRDLSTPHQGVGTHGPRPLQPGPGPVAFAGPQLVVRARGGTRNTGGIYGHRGSARESGTLEPSHRLRQQARQQARRDLVTAEPPQRGMSGHRRQPQSLLEWLRTGQQRRRPALVQRQIRLQAQTGQQRRLPRALRGKCAGIVRQLLACDPHSQAYQAHSIMAFHGASPPQP